MENHWSKRINNAVMKQSPQVSSKIRYLYAHSLSFPCVLVEREREREGEREYNPFEFQPQTFAFDEEMDDVPVCDDRVGAGTGEDKGSSSSNPSTLKEGVSSDKGKESLG